MLWFQGTKWEELVTSDFLTIVPIPHFNDIEAPVKLPLDCLPFMTQKSSELISMWVDCHNWNYKPSDFRENNAIFQEDLSAFHMLDRLQEDGRKYQEARQKVEQKNREYIEQERAKFKASRKTGRR
jgi:hypothetical protein